MVEWGGLENRCGFAVTGGSNPPLSAVFRFSSPIFGEMAERSKVHDWKSCVGLSPTEGSNPSLSAIFRQIRVGQ